MITLKNKNDESDVSLSDRILFLEIEFNLILNSNLFWVMNSRVEVNGFLSSPIAYEFFVVFYFYLAFFPLLLLLFSSYIILLNRKHVSGIRWFEMENGRTTFTTWKYHFNSFTVNIYIWLCLDWTYLISEIKYRFYRDSSHCLASLLHEFVAILEAGFLLEDKKDEKIHKKQKMKCSITEREKVLMNRVLLPKLVFDIRHYKSTLSHFCVYNSSHSWVLTKFQIENWAFFYHLFSAFGRSYH
jgi:hypothetical protein